MINIFQYSEIAESTERVLNPLADAKVDLLGELLALESRTRILDLGAGKGEMLCRWAAHHGVTGTGVDIHGPFVDVARARAVELGIDDRVRFLVGDGAEHSDAANSYDVGIAIGTTWIGGGLLGTIDLLRRWVVPDGLLALGEFSGWTSHPTNSERSMMRMASSSTWSAPSIGYATTASTSWNSSSQALTTGTATRRGCGPTSPSGSLLIKIIPRPAR